MTYKELFDLLSRLDPEDHTWQDTITIYDAVDDEFYSVQSYEVADYDNDVIDPDHLFLVIKD